jgi:hypothetical protein
MNCPKCIIDSGKVRAAAIHLKESAETWMKTIDELYDSNKSPVPLTDVEAKTIVEASQNWCDTADQINDMIRETNDTICAIAVAHTHAPSARK